MFKAILQKGELTSLILNEVRKHEGCEGVDAIVVLESKSPLSMANWEIGIVVASKNPTAVKNAVTSVQKQLQRKYSLG
jgi:hypothetical protein